jgi:AraC family transcriptional regulator
MTAAVPVKATTQLDYGRRIARVMAYIDENLDGDLKLDRLAEVACFSPYHFHRIYRWITGETVADTIRRLRLHRAANELARQAASIERVARRAGYGSVEAFSRAFAADHGRPPAAFRADQLAPFPRNGDDTMDVTIKTFEPAHVAALAHRGDYTQIGRSFEQLSAWAAPRGLMDRPTRILALFYDDPESVPQAELRSDACIEVPPGTAVEGEIKLLTVPAGRMASVIHKGPYAELHRVYSALYGGWLPQSGEEAADRPPIEVYLNSPRDNPPSEWLTEVLLPLK